MSFVEARGLGLECTGTATCIGVGEALSPTTATTAWSDRSSSSSDSMSSDEHWTGLDCSDAALELRLQWRERSTRETLLVRTFGHWSEVSAKRAGREATDAATPAFPIGLGPWKRTSTPDLMSSAEMHEQSEPWKYRRIPSDSDYEDSVVRQNFPDLCDYYFDEYHEQLKPVMRECCWQRWATIPEIHEYLSRTVAGMAKMARRLLVVKDAEEKIRKSLRLGTATSAAPISLDSAPALSQDRNFPYGVKIQEVSIFSTTKLDGVIYYRIHVKTNKGDRVVEKRYSQFLPMAVGTAAWKLPPKWSVAGLVRKARFLRARLVGLDGFLQHMLETDHTALLKFCRLTRGR